MQASSSAGALVERLTYAAAGARLGLSANAVRNRCRRGTLDCEHTPAGPRVLLPVAEAAEEPAAAQSAAASIRANPRTVEALERALAEAIDNAAAWRRQAEALSEQNARLIGIVQAEHVSRALGSGTIERHPRTASETGLGASQTARTMSGPWAWLRSVLGR